MTKKLVDIDIDLLEAAQRVLEAPTIKATVNGALQEVVDRREIAAHLDWLASDEHDLADDEVMRNAWRS